MELPSVCFRFSRSLDSLIRHVDGRTRAGDFSMDTGRCTFYV